MATHAITMLGTGLIGEFYTMTLHGQRRPDRVRVVYSRSDGRGEAFAERWEHMRQEVEHFEAENGRSDGVSHSAADGASEGRLDLDPSQS